MFLNDNFKILLRIFYWNGLAPFPDIDAKVRCFNFVLSATVSSLINIGLVAVVMIFPLYESYGNIAIILNYAYMGSLSIANLCGNVQCYSYKTTYRKIVCRIEKIEMNFNSKFSERISFGTAAHQYKSKMLLVSVHLFTVCILKLYESWLQGGYQMYLITSLTILSHCMSVLVLFHNMLYIFVVQVFVCELNGRIRNAPLCFYASSKVEFLKIVKLLHMDISKLMMQVNRFFSCSLPMLVIHLAIQATYYVYWIFLILQVEWSFLYIVELLNLLLYGLVKLSMLVNCCESISVETSILMEHIERYAFWTNDKVQLYQLKNEILEQIERFPIFVTADGYFLINRSFLAGMALNCCTYIIIFIQFYLDSAKNK